MKNIIVATMAVLAMVSCSNNDDCTGNKQQIFDKYTRLIDQAHNNHDQVERLRDERDRMLANACN